MRCLRSLLAILTVLIIGSRLIAQNPAVLPRIAGPVDEKSMVVLAGHVSPLAIAEFDRGQAPASTQLTRVRLVLARSSTQQAALDKYDAELQDKNSPNYHKWLTPEQYGKLYGPADSDISAIVSWLESHGLQVDALSPGRTNISFSGTALQIERLFRTSIHSFEMNGEKFFANTSNPQIPAALAPLISGVAHLNTIKPKPQLVRAGAGMFDPGSRQLKPASAAASTAPHANLTYGSGTSASPYELFITPGDAATIYNTPNSVLNAKFPATSTSYTGHGVTIGIGGDATVNPNTIVSYRRRFISATDNNPPTILYCTDLTATAGAETCSSSTTGLTIGTADQDESYLDIQVAGGLAPGATIIYYASDDLFGGVEYAINKNDVDIFNLSFGGCEQLQGTGANQLINDWWQQAATQGIAVTVSSGDSGSAGCDIPDTSKTQIALQGLGVNGLGSTPYNLAVGGTDFTGLASSFATYVATTSAPATFYRSALGYIPESTWNDSVQTNTTVSAAAAYADPGSGNNNIIAGSGGKSSCSVSTGSSCTSGYPKPVWQRGTGVPSDSVRDVPDISLMSGVANRASWLICDDGTFLSGGVTYTQDCTTQTGNTFAFVGIGGTSAAAPAFAGILALVQEKASAGRLGQAAREIYDLYNGAHASAIFHDTTTGHISVPCSSGTPNCQRNTAGNLFLTGYDTNAGYDLSTGLGSVDVVQLITYWGTATGSGTTTVTVTPSATTLTRATAISADITIQGTAATGNPTGTVVLSGGGFNSGAQALTASGADSATVTVNIPANSLAGGTDTLTASYSGDGNYSLQTGTATVTVTVPTPTVTVVPAIATPNSGAALNVTVTVVAPAGTGTPTGNVTLSGGGYNSGAKALDGTGKVIITIPAFTFTAGGAITLTASYPGDAGFNSASGTGNITVTVSTFTLSATAVTVTAGDTTNNASTVTVTPANGYTGTVTLTAAVLNPPAGSILPTFTGSAVAITNANPQTGTVTVATAAATAARPGNPGTAWFHAAGGTALVAFLLFFVPLGSRRGRRILSVLLVVAAATFTVVGCGSGGGGGGGGGGSQKTTPSVTVSPSKTTFSSDTAITVAVSVAGGTQTPTGNVTLTGGGFTGTATALASGAATISIPANTLSTGSVTLTASYAGDTNFNTATGTSTVTVNKPKTTAGAYTVTVTGTGNDAAHTTKTATFTLTVN